MSTGSGTGLQKYLFYVEYLAGAVARIVPGPRGVPVEAVITTYIDQVALCLDEVTGTNILQFSLDPVVGSNGIFH